MKQIKRIAALALVLAITAGAAAMYRYSRNWPVRFSRELDAFFGEGSWACISEETKESLIYSEYVTVRSNPALSGEVPGKFTNWYLQFENRSGETEVWYITDHAYRINHDEYWLLSPKRYSAKQALTLELMDVSFGMVGEEIMENVIQRELSEEEAACIEVTVSYDGGNPKPEFYDDLAAQPWFTANGVTAGDYLAYDAHDFYLQIRAHDYRLEELTEQQRQNVLESLDAIVETLCAAYGDDASFWIYLDAAHKAEYRGGVPVGA